MLGPPVRSWKSVEDEFHEFRTPLASVQLVRRVGVVAPLGASTWWSLLAIPNQRFEEILRGELRHVLSGRRMEELILHAPGQDRTDKLVLKVDAGLVVAMEWSVLDPRIDRYEWIFVHLSWIALAGGILMLLLGLGTLLVVSRRGSRTPSAVSNGPT